MLYRNIAGEKVSWLGLGNMRLPTTGERGPIDREKAAEMIDYAYKNGINYFDTAYRYHGGESESFVGEALSRYPRDTWYLASKFPGHMMSYKDGKLSFTGMMADWESPASIGEVFENQLKKCQVDYFDFYLLHNLCESAWEFYTDDELKVVEYFKEQKRLGKIKHLGFSAHARADTIDKFLALHPGVFDLVQIQLNYVDWVLQAAGDKYDVIKKHGASVVVMEPVRGGGLANMNEKATSIFKAANPDATIASWALRYLQELDGVGVVLSGMSNMEQLKENIALYSVDNPLSADEKKVVDEVVKTLVDLVPCTACRYCVDDCPQKLDIPTLISMYNELSSAFGNPSIMGFTLGGMKKEELPSACISCGACTAACPQSIDVPAVMEKFAQTLANSNR